MNKESNISICIPTYNEADNIERLLSQLKNWSDDIIVADGGSQDATQDIVRAQQVKLVTGAKGRAAQMNLAAKYAQNDWLWFVHADTQFADGFDAKSIFSGLKRPGWGRFNVKLSGEQRMFKVISFMINWRSRVTQVATGDQGIFVSRELFERIGGYADLPLMEDIELTKRLRKIEPCQSLKDVVITSSRRWQKKGTVKTILLMWWLRLAYVFGVPASRIASWYR